MSDASTSEELLADDRRTTRRTALNRPLTFLELGPRDERRLWREARERTAARRARVAEASARSRITASTGTTMATSSTMSQASSQATPSGVGQSGSQASISQSVGLQVSQQAQLTPELHNSLLCVAETQVVQREVLAELVAGQKRLLAALQAPRPVMRQPQFAVASPSVAGPSMTPSLAGPSFSPMFGMPPPGGYVATSGPVLGVSVVPSTTVVTTVPLSSHAQVLLTDYLRCLPSEVRTKLVDEAYVEQHNFASFSKKALDIEAKLGSAHQSQEDGRKKRLPQDWKKKGQLMFVDHDGQATEIDDFPDLGEETKHDGASETSDGGVVAPIKEKARGTGKKKVGQSIGQGDQGVVEREVVHAIEVVPGSKVPRGRIYGMSPAELDELRCQLKELTEKGWIRPSTSPYGAPVLFVPKKGGTLRMCIDYRGLDAITVKNAERPPRIDDLLDRVQGCRYFTKIDLKSGYHQIAIRPEYQHKTAFQTRYGLYEFVVMPFGLCNAPGTFQHAMNRIFHEYLDKFIVVYLDDILIFSRTAQEHAEHLKIVLGLLRQHQYKVNLEKCEFGRTKILYLGHEISADGLRPDDAKVASIRDWSRPQTVTVVRSFLGMTGYYRPFVKNYSTIDSPLTDLSQLDTPLEWTKECEAAFRKVKYALTHYEVLKLPDPDKPFVVTTNASQYGSGAVLVQKEGPKLQPIEYISKKMSSQKLAKSTFERELYALYRALVHWRHYLLGRFFYVRSDHETLRWIKTQPVLSDALKRWIQVIDMYDYQLDPIKGFGRKLTNWAKTQTVDSFVDLVEQWFRDPTTAQKATNALCMLETHKYRNVQAVTEKLEEEEEEKEQDDEEEEQEEDYNEEEETDEEEEHEKEDEEDEDEDEEEEGVRRRGGGGGGGGKRANGGGSGDGGKAVRCEGMWGVERAGMALWRRQRGITWTATIEMKRMRRRRMGRTRTTSQT
ncbi:hypothetical protein CBR_g19609 [Chara braunii]|uniref:Reverse transcriptase domain-containing protein n=1 Tax=Chara braunii TaxID=69332 RepID=A0A388KYG0_CHABU|nr:hypothetical protein CBR_g19609 [Chara braunii]|eukprot:GBG75096.1 hypothetical protein CBR_g19609 [Chara braunii]